MKEGKAPQFKGGYHPQGPKPRSIEIDISKSKIEIAFKSILTAKLYEDRLFIQDTDTLVTDPKSEQLMAHEIIKEFKTEFGITRLALVTNSDCSEEIVNASRNHLVDLLDVKYVTVQNIVKNQQVGIRRDVLEILCKSLDKK